MALNYDELVKSQTENPPQYGQQGQAITLNQLNPITPIKLPEQTFDTTKADSLVSGANAGVKSLADYTAQATPEPTALDTKYQSFLDSITQLTEQGTGKSQALAQAKIDSGAVDLNKQLAELTGQINIGNAEFAKLTADEEAQKANLEANASGITTSVLTGQQGAVQRQFLAQKATKAAEIGMLAARAQAVSGNLSTALQIAQNAVDAKYAPIEDALKVKQAQLEAIKPLLDKQEKIQAEARQRLYEDEKIRNAEEKADQKTNISFALTAGINTQFANQNGKFFNTRTGETYKDPTSFFKAAGVTSFEQAYQRGLVSDLSNAKLQDINTIQQIIAKYPDAGVRVTDTLEQAKAKLASSPTYRKDTYIAPSPYSGGGGGTTMSYDTSASNLTPEQQTALQNVPKAEQNNVAMLVNGEILLSDLVKTRGAAGTKQIQSLLNYAKSVDPTFSENTNKIRYAFMQKWLSTESGVGKNRTAINTALGHLADASEDAAKLDNKSLKFINKTKNWWSAETGNPQVAVLQTDINALAAELAAVYKNGTAPTDQETESWRKVLGTEFSNNQFKGVFNQAAKLLSSKITSVRYQYKTTMGKEYNQTVIDPEKLQALVEAGIDPNAISKENIGGGSIKTLNEIVNPLQMNLNGKILNLQPDGTYQ